MGAACFKLVERLGGLEDVSQRRLGERIVGSIGQSKQNRAH